MKPIDIIILIVAVAIVGGVIALSVIRKKQGKPIGCDCASCNGRCSSCSKSNLSNKEQTEV